MSVEVTSQNTLDPTICEGNFLSLINDLNLAAATGKQFVILQELNGGPVALETRAITRIRELQDAFIGQ